MTSTLDAIGLRHGTDKASRGHDYLRHYEAVLGHWRDEAFTLLEIGALNGAGLATWAEFFPRARIVCLDPSPEAARFATDRITIVTGNPASREVLADLRAAEGPFRIVIDDGSHRWDHQRVALLALFEAVEPGGVYIAEDLHTSHEPGFAGRDDLPFTDLLKRLLDHLNTRPERRRDLERMMSAALLSVASGIEAMQFVPRACLLKKKLS